MPIITRSRNKAQLPFQHPTSGVADAVKKASIVTTQVNTKKRDHDSDNEAYDVPPAKKKAKARTKPKAVATVVPEAPKASQTPIVTQKVAAKSRPKMTKTEREKKRVKDWQSAPPEEYAKARKRALTQRMFVIERERTGTEDVPEERVELAGSTGNIYKVYIREVPFCNCPQGRMGKFCKHIIYVLTQVLKAPPELEYQYSFLASELHAIFNGAPLPIDTIDESHDGNRKAIEDDCPICCFEMEQEKEPVTWCQAACGNNMHKSCFDKWAATKRASGSKVTCPYCRSEWQDSAVPQGPMRKLANGGVKGRDGYRNIGAALGLPSKRNYSSANDEVRDANELFEAGEAGQP
ncbi:hypothetical protein EJ05DRAFT_498969 [Pseudovirgaria hyperparasitica]|uniref:Uncharacterized protein n=1 Tax=Pseudovirgaria hyperparasitica TaxID=470096 RepID=A0A6A6WDX6_9PEZI|nr:uncharacterized protein EJ05DRAFT_498969 [Pseudovirgaria hyperparasitica]KAF2759767.1 hypothetical protein EJ05DRAFT_498969 [Pseudovirgaria hyperparasitica]